MAFDLHLHIDSGTPESQALEAIVEREHITPEEAIRVVLRRAGDTSYGQGQEKVTQHTDEVVSAQTGNGHEIHINDDTPGAQLIGLMSSPEDAALMDEVVEMAMAARRKHWERILDE
jgi:hypothetical protein